MKRALVLLASVAALLVAGCSKVTQDNYAKVQNGMTEQEVTAILGPPSESTTRELLGISGTSSVWRGGGAEINIRFVGGKVAIKSFDKPGAGKAPPAK